VFVGGAFAAGLASAQSIEATPVRPADCTVPMRSFDELCALIRAGLPRVMAAIADNEATPVGSPQPALDLSPGVPADPATISAADFVAQQVAACTNAVQIGALLSLYDDEAASLYGAVAYVSFVRGVTGGADPVDDSLLDLFLGSLQISAPLPAEDRIVAYRVDSVMVLDDRLVSVVASFAKGDAGLSLECSLLAGPELESTLRQSTEP
jgi:hypothetical protein